MDNSNTKDLAEPLLVPQQQQQQQQQHEEVVVGVSGVTETAAAAAAAAAFSLEHENETNASNSNGNGNSTFSYHTELNEMLQLGLPLAVSFFCRMAMASTDSSFVGHIRDAHNTPEVYLAAAVVSDMVVNLCITPPLAFNQVLNGLVGQAVGSQQPQMAGIWLQQSMFWLTLTMLPCLLGLRYVEHILLMLKFPADICRVAGMYAKYNVLWPIPNGLYQCLRFYFQAIGLPRPAMYNNLIFLAINALLNWIFVFGGPFRTIFPEIFGTPAWHGLGFIGAAISLSISRTMQGICYFLYMFTYKQYHLQLQAWPLRGWAIQHHTLHRTKEFMKQSVPNIGTLLFQAAASQATTVLVGRLGQLSIAASSALSTVTIPWSGTLGATTSTISAVRVGYHLGRGDAKAAQKSATLVLHAITLTNVLMAVVLVLGRHKVLEFATDDASVLKMAATLVPAMLVGTYLNLLVGNITSGVFSGQGRPLIATMLSFGFELPMSIGGVAVYILMMHGNLLGVYWWGAISGAIEAVLVLYLMYSSDWDQCADDAMERQEASQSTSPLDSTHSSSIGENGGRGGANDDGNVTESSNQVRRVLPIASRTAHADDNEESPLDFTGNQLDDHGDDMSQPLLVCV